VDDRGRIAIAIGVGAIVGGVAGYLFLTERGRAAREGFEPRLNEVLGEVDRLRETFERTRSAVSEGWRSFNQLMNEPEVGQSGTRTWGRTVQGQPH
jgi:gas vesicle protein